MPFILLTRKYRMIRQRAWITLTVVMVGFMVRTILAQKGILPMPPNTEDLAPWVFGPMGIALALICLWVMPDAIEGRNRRANRARGDLNEPPQYATMDELWPPVSIWKPILTGLAILAAIEIKLWMQ